MREERIGWIRTISALDEKSFPLGIKQVSLKELAVIFPSALVALMFFSKSIFIAAAALVPALFIITYDEKSMDEFQYVSHFLKFYLHGFASKPEAAKEKTQRKKEMKKIEIHLDLAQIRQNLIANKKRAMRAGVDAAVLAVLLAFLGRDFTALAANLAMLLAVSIAIAIVLIELLKSVYGKI